MPGTTHDLNTMLSNPDVSIPNSTVVNLLSVLTYPTHHEASLTISLNTGLFANNAFSVTFPDIVVVAA